MTTDWCILNFAVLYVTSEGGYIMVFKIKTVIGAYSVINGFLVFDVTWYQYERQFIVRASSIEQGPVHMENIGMPEVEETWREYLSFVASFCLLFIIVCIFVY